MPMRRLHGPTILYTLENNNKVVKMRIQRKKHFIINNNNNATARTPSVTPTPLYRHNTTQ